MKKTALIGIASLVLAAITASLIWGHTASAKYSATGHESHVWISRKPNSPPPNSQANSQASLQTKDWLVSGPGRVEPYSEDIKLGAELSGRLRIVSTRSARARYWQN